MNEKGERENKECKAGERERKRQSRRKIGERVKEEREREGRSNSG